jgi:hypothetical protein
VNINYGGSIGFESRTVVDEAIGGAEFFDQRRAPRIAQIRLGYMTTDEAYSRAFELQRLLDVHGEVFFMYDPDDTLHLIRRSWLARCKTLSAIEHPYLDNHATAFELKEIL